MKLKRHCFVLDLKDDPKLIAEYIEYHHNVWPEIIKSFKESGIENLEIYQIANRLVMIMEVNGTFSFEMKSESDRKNSKVQEWEHLMWKYQQAIPAAKPNEKWLMMAEIFKME